MKKQTIDTRSSGQMKGVALAVALAALAFSAGVQARGLTHPVDPDYKGSVSVTNAPVYPGDTAEVSGSGFKPGQDVKLLSDGDTITSQPILRVDAEGKFTAQVPVPPESPVGLHPVVVQTVNPGYAEVIDFKISPKIPFSVNHDYNIKRAALNPGLYQGAYSAKNHAVFVTSAVGRPPVKVSSLMKINPSSLALEAQIVPAATADGKQVEAVYGIAVDDETDTVWTGNTRTGAVAVYKQSDLSLVKQFDDKIAPHNHGVAVDGKRHRAYVAAHGKNYVNIFNTLTLEEKTRLELVSPTRTKTTPAPLSFAVDEANGKLFATSTTDQLYVIDQATETIEKVYNLKGLKGAMSVAYAPEKGLLFVVGQQTDNLQILNAADGTLKSDTKVGANPLAVTWDPVHKRAWVANRASNSVAVVDANGNLTANLMGGSYANHVFTDGKGVVWALNKSRGATDTTGDHISRFSFK
jgi:hypothetical protein